MDFLSTITEVHPTLDDLVSVQSMSFSDDTLSKLEGRVVALEEDKKLRLEKLQELAGQLRDLWNLMDAPEKETSLFDHVTCNIFSTIDEVTIPGALALDFIEQDEAEVEVERLDELKASKMKEIALKKQTELEEIYLCVHIDIDYAAAQDKIMAHIDFGNLELAELFANFYNQVDTAKEEALSRKEILEKVKQMDVSV